MKEKNIIFFIGTTAELIKLFPIILNLKKENISYKIIASGQNNFTNSDIVKKTNLKIDLELSNEDSIKKNAVGLFSWFGKTLILAKRKIVKAFPDVDFERSIIVVHGDTISTVMGAILGKMLKAKVAHVEAGLRSGHILIPFPEEIDRNIVSYIADYSYAPGDWAASNLEKYNSEVINTKTNTIVDALTISNDFELENNCIKDILEDDYAVFVNHRQENLMNKRLVTKIVNQAIETAKTKKVVFILHKITEDTLVSMGLLGKLKLNDNIMLLKRVEYFDFMKLLQGSDFVITDGGSNQEELYYMGKPTLIIRTRTERKEGLGENAILFNNNFDLITDFSKNFNKYKRNIINPSRSPSDIISESLNRILNNL